MFITRAVNFCGHHGIRKIRKFEPLPWFLVFYCESPRIWLIFSVNVTEKGAIIVFYSIEDERHGVA